MIVLLCCSHYIFQNCRGGEKAQVLEGTGDAERYYFIRLQLIDILALKFKFSACNIVDTCYKVEYCRLSRSVGADKSGKFSGLYLKRHILNCLDTSECFVDTFKFKHCRH